MKPTGTSLPGSLPGIERVLGRVRGPEAGPTLLGVGGLHGNEVAGVLALRRVLEVLQTRSDTLSGELLGLTGNRRALERGRRYLFWDLNRSWTGERLQAVRRPGPDLQGEDQEQGELLEAIQEAESEARGPLFLLDLHTTSGPSVPFTAIMDSQANREFALSFPVPLVLGFGEQVDGTFFGYLTGQGITSVVFEGGQHEDPLSVDTSEAAVWLALAHAGVIQEDAHPEVKRARESLKRLARALPPILEIRHRHAVTSGDGFRMRPGFQNFQPVSRGELLARDHLGEVKSPEAGRLLLPLYQAQGDDGFFLIREPSQALRSGAA